MPALKKNILANLLGGGWSALMSVIFLPLYVHFMGIESYALVGFYVALQALLMRLDVGLGAVVARELARLSALADAKEQMRHLLRTLELICWALAALIVVLVNLLAPWLSIHWFSTHSLTAGTIETVVRVMGVVIAMRLLYGFYCNGLSGLQQQVVLNVARMGVESLVALGAVLVLWRITPTVEAFFFWQMTANAVGVLVMSRLLWRHLGGVEKPRFRFSLFRDVWGFSWGMSGISLLAAMLAQADKVVLSAILPMALFGYYAMAAAVATGVIFLLSSPVFSAIYPKFTQLVARGDEAAVTALYHKGCQLMAMLVMPVSLILAMFSSAIVAIWTQDDSLTKQVAPVLSLLVMAAGINGMQYLAYALQLANGWTRLALFLNLGALGLLVGGLLLIVPEYGVGGAAMVWVCINGLYMLINIPVMHRHLLTGELSAWLVFDLLLPALAALVVVSVGRMLMPADMYALWQLIWIAGVAVLAVLATGMAGQTMRREISEFRCRLRKPAEAGHKES